MRIPIIFKSKDKIRRWVNGKHVMVLYPGSENHGTIIDTGNIRFNSPKYDEIFEVKRSEVNVIAYL